MNIEDTKSLASNLPSFTAITATQEISIRGLCETALWLAQGRHANFDTDRRSLLLNANQPLSNEPGRALKQLSIAGIDIHQVTEQQLQDYLWWRINMVSS